MIRIGLTPHGSSSYAQALALRRRWLREPLGLDFTAAELAADAQSFHIVAMLDEAVVGNVTLTPSGDGVLKLRQMIVDPSLREQGVGRRLVEAAEALARERRYRAIEMLARESAVGFYEHCGYVAFGESFVEVTLPHRAMRKTIG